ncbi:MAG: YpdA family putative bacillithiol disulfide reductase [Saprospiraceae bacterium]|nr:YpdA family putative bacillithiol disulfide reductase [Saprospiraceae bacterium]
MQTDLDIIIIGGGPAGINCAIEAQKQGLRYLILEKGVLVNSLYHFPTNMTFFSTSKKLEIGDVPFISHNEKPTRSEALEYYRRVVESFELQIHLYEAVTGLDRLPSGEYQVHSAKARYTAPYIIVATGFYDTPRLMDIPGENLPKVRHYYDEVHPYIGQEVLVIGAANSACDVALETYHKGARVSMAIRGSEIGERVKYWIRPNIINRINEGSIKAWYETEVVEIKPHSVLLKTPEGITEIPNDFVLAMTGYKPNYAFLEKLGLPVSPAPDCEPIHDPETLETPLDGVFVSGVLNAGMNTSRLFIENTREQGASIIRQILQKRALISAK